MSTCVAIRSFERLCPSVVQAECVWIEQNWLIIAKHCQHPDILRLKCLCYVWLAINLRHDNDHLKHPQWQMFVIQPQLSILSNLYCPYSHTVKEIFYVWSILLLITTIARIPRILLSKVHLKLIISSIKFPVRFHRNEIQFYFDFITLYLISFLK